MAANPLQANCNQVIQDCNKALNDADKTIHARDLMITDLTQSRDQMLKSDKDLREDLEKANASRMAWYHEPAILIPAGIIGGLLLGHYLTK